MPGRLQGARVLRRGQRGAHRWVRVQAAGDGGERAFVSSNRRPRGFSRFAKDSARGGRDGGIDGCAARQAPRRVRVHRGAEPAGGRGGFTGQRGGRRVGDDGG